MRLSACLLLPSLLVAEVAPVAPAPMPDDAGQETSEIYKRPYLGVTIDENSSTFAGVGLVVERVMANSTAAAMGVATGDVLTSLNGTKLKEVAQLRGLISQLETEAPVTLALTRAGKPLELQGTLRALPHPRMQVERLRELNQAIRALRSEKERLAAGAGDDQPVDLAQAMQHLADTLNALPARLEETSQAFKEVYPKGRFEIRIEIDISTDASADDAVDLSPQGPEAREDGVTAGP